MLQLFRICHASAECQLRMTQAVAENLPFSALAAWQLGVGRKSPALAAWGRERALGPQVSQPAVQERKDAKDGQHDHCRVRGQALQLAQEVVRIP